jgi:hypothetical protein
MTTAEVLDRLQAPRFPLRNSFPSLPAKPGLYAIHGSRDAWVALGLGDPIPNLPLYVGKAEDSLVARDIRTHFEDGRTGSSTVRRSLAALLCDDLNLSAMPRNPAQPGYFPNYALSDADDMKLTHWMRERLELAVWVWDRSRTLRKIESDVLSRLNPPINIAGVDHRWKAHLRHRRRLMADQARAWPKD